MKHGKKPTREQRKLLLKNDLDPREWLVTHDNHLRMILVSRNDKNTTRTIYKEV